MNDLRKHLLGLIGQARSPAEDDPKSRPQSRGRSRGRRHLQYVLQEPTPLTEDEIRSLPVANRFSA